MLLKVIHTTPRLSSSGRRMRKDGSVTGNSVGKMFVCIESRPLLATLLALTLVMVIWNLQPYYENLLSASHPPSSPSPSPCNASTTHSHSRSHYENTSTTPLPETKKFKRLFHAYGNAASLFVLMGAYRGGPRTFAAVGLASKPLHVFGHPWYKCEWISNNKNASVRKSKAYKMLPDWGYGRVYTVVVVNCTFLINPNEDNSGGRLNLYAYYGVSSKKYEKINAALEEQPGSYNESKYHPPYDYDYLYCGSSLYGNLSSARIREWMAYHAWFFGPKSHFVFHDAGGVSADVKLVLEPWVGAGRATIQDIRDQSEFDGYYYNQFLVVNDCLHRYRYSANWTFYFDVDEYIYLPASAGSRDALDSVMNHLSKFTQFTIEQNPMSSAICLTSDSAHSTTHSAHSALLEDYSRQWGFEKLLFRDSRTGIRRDRKYAIQAKNAFATGVHMSENVIGNTSHNTESMIRYYHYHNSISVLGEPCREFVPISAKTNVTWFNKLPYVYDDNMKNLANTIKEFERKTLGTSNSKLYS